MAADRVPQPVRRLLLWPLGALPVRFRARRLARRLMGDATQRYVDLMRQMSPAGIEALLTPAAAERLGGDGAAPVGDAFDAARDLDPLSRMQYADGRVYLPDDLLVKIDRASMLHALEVRCPFLDPRWLELMAAVPPHLRRAGGHGKRGLRESMRGVLPARVLERPKAGFVVPLTTWFRGTLDGFAREVLLDRRTVQRGILRPAAVERLLDERARPVSPAPQLWAALVFETWCRAYLDDR